MTWDCRWTRELTGAVTVLAGTGFLFGWAAIRLLHEDMASAVSAAVVISPPATPVPRPGTSAEIRQQAITANPFRPERSPAPLAFRMPSDAAPGAEAPSRAPEEGLLLVGTALLPGGRSFAMCRIGADPPRVVRVGERVGDYTLRVVTQGQARFETATGHTIDIRVPKAGT